MHRTPGFRVVGVAATGATALAEIQRLRPDLVLLDVHLPDLQRDRRAARLRAAGDDTGVVMVTAAREADTVRAAAAGGAAHYLVKPFEYDDLRARLEAFRQARLALPRSAHPRPRTTSTRSSPPWWPPGREALPKGLSAPTRRTPSWRCSAGYDFRRRMPPKGRHLPWLSAEVPRALRRAPARSRYA